MWIRTIEINATMQEIKHSILKEKYASIDLYVYACSVL